MALPLAAAAGISAAANIAGGLIGGRAASKAAKEAAAAQAAAFAEAKKRLEDVGIPDIEAQKILLQTPEFAGMADAVMLGESALSGVETDPAFENARRNALRALEERSVTGLTAEDKLAAQQLRDSVLARQQAADQNILTSMSERGMLDSGATLAQRLLANQNAAQNEQRAALELAAQGQQNRMNALRQAAGLAGEMQNTQYSRAAELANKADTIAQINAANTMDTQRFNLGRQDQQNINVANIRNQQEIANKGLLQQRFSNEMAKAGGLNNLTLGSGQALADAATQAGQGKAQMWSGIGAGVGQAFSGYQNMYNDRLKSLAEYNKNAPAGKKMTFEA